MLKKKLKPTSKTLSKQLAEAEEACWQASRAVEHAQVKLLLAQAEEAVVVFNFHELQRKQK